MQVKYVGPKPIISENGITFDARHDDRYTYLNIVIQLLQALENGCFEEKTYRYAVDNKRLSEDEMIAGLQHYCGNLADVVKESVEEENRQIDSELAQAKENRDLTESGQNALIRNIELMRNYRVQFTINDILYDCAVKRLASYIRKESLDYVLVPMFQRFAAVLHSVQLELADQEATIDTRMEIFEEDGKLMAKMEIKRN